MSPALSPVCAKRPDSVPNPCSTGLCASPVRVRVHPSTRVRSKSGPSPVLSPVGPSVCPVGVSSRDTHRTEDRTPSQTQTPRAQGLKEDARARPRPPELDAHHGEGDRHCRHAVVVLGAVAIWRRRTAAGWDPFTSLPPPGLHPVCTRCLRLIDGSES